MQGMKLDRVFVERGVSGSVPLAVRPEGAAMLATLQAGDVVVSPKLDRVFRSALDALQQTEASGPAVSVCTSSTSAATLPATACRGCS
jgi:resolvase-like protein